MPSVSRTVVWFTAVAAVASVFLVSVTVFADGIPTPLPEAKDGPSTDAINAIAATYGLSCQASPVSDGLAETFCLRVDSSGLRLSATYYTNPTLVLEATAAGQPPFPSEADTFLRDITAPFCAPESADALSEIITNARTSGQDETVDTLYCQVTAFYVSFPPNATQVVDALAKTAAPSPAPSISTSPATPTPLPTATLPAPPSPAPTAAPTPTSSPTATQASVATPSPTLAPVPPPDEQGRIGPGAFVTSIPTPSQISTEPIVIAESVGLAALVVLLMPFPAQLFNSTLEENYDDVRRWFRLDRAQKAAGRFGGFWDSALGISLFVLVAAVIYALLDPAWGPDVAGLVTLVGLALGIALTTWLASATSLAISSQRRDGWRVRVLPATLLVGLACVFVSRITGFLPGYVYGVVLGFVFVRALSAREQGRSNAIAAAAMLVISVIAWILLAALTPAVVELPAADALPGIVGTIVTSILAMTMVACLEGVVFGLLPFRFLPGEPVFSSNRLLWSALLGIGAFLFFHIVINPASGYLSDSTRTPLFTIVALLIGFGVLSVAFWAYFRRRSRTHTTD